MSEVNPHKEIVHNVVQIHELEERITKLCQEMGEMTRATHRRLVALEKNADAGIPSRGDIDQAYADLRTLRAQLRRTGHTPEV